MKICFASSNKNKIRELGEILDGIHEIVGLEELGVTEDIPETGTTLEENSRIKAIYVHERFNIPVISDDSGLIVHSLNGEPGVYSARYAGEAKDDNANMNLLLSRLGEHENRSAEFQTVITYIDASGKEVQFLGSIPGIIIYEKRGKNGFGYDPIFQPSGYDLTFAELSSKEKNQISHRAIAVQKLAKHLNQTNG